MYPRVCSSPSFILEMKGKLPTSILFSALLLVCTPILSAGTFDSVAELPRVTVQSSLSSTPAPGKAIRLAAGADLQQALNSASCGDTIFLQAGAVFTGN